MSAPVYHLRPVRTQEFCSTSITTTFVSYCNIVQRDLQMGACDVCCPYSIRDGPALEIPLRRCGKRPSALIGNGGEDVCMSCLFLELSYAVLQTYFLWRPNLNRCLRSAQTPLRCDALSFYEVPPLLTRLALPLPANRRSRNKRHG